MENEPAPSRMAQFFRLPNIWALILGVAVIVCTAILCDTISMRENVARTVAVTGSGSRQMRSDWIVWTGTITSFHATDKVQCAGQLKGSREAVAAYLQEQGIDSTRFEFSSIDVNEKEERLYNNEGDFIGNKFLGYEMSQQVTIQTDDIDRVKFISRDITSLLSDGVDIASCTPSYYLRNLGDLKLSLIDEATENAKTRAKKLIKGFAKLSDIAKIDIGVFQITGLYSDEDYSYGGSYNTTSEWKEVSVTVHATYGIK